MEVIEHSIITLTADDLRRRTLLDRTKMNAPRTPGVHLSGVLKYLAYSPGGALADGKAQSQPCDYEEEYPTIMACGVMWEEFAVSLYKGIEWQPGERERDGIYGTPDGISWDQEVLPKNQKHSIRIDLLDEFKFTTKGIRSPEQVWWWQRQALGFCALTGLNHVRWHVNWAHGDYKKMRWPTYTRTLVRFEDEEIEGWWKVILKNKGKATAE